jgi:hypothetical protein
MYLKHAPHCRHQGGGTERGPEGPHFPASVFEVAGLRTGQLQSSPPGGPEARRSRFRLGRPTLAEGVLKLPGDDVPAPAFTAPDAQHQAIGVFHRNPGRALTCQRWFGRIAQVPIDPRIAIVYGHFAAKDRKRDGGCSAKKQPPPSTERRKPALLAKR